MRTRIEMALARDLWAVDESELRELVRRASGHPSAVHAQNAGTLENYVNELIGPPPSLQIEDGIGTLMIAGVLVKGAGPLDRFFFGGEDVDHYRAQIQEAADNPKVQGLILRFDSPGGSVTGIPEFGSQVAAFPKPVVAFTDTQMCSAAYWLGAQADAVVASPSAIVGSIGVISSFYDVSQMLAAVGVKPEVFTSGDLKAAGIGSIPLTEDQRADWQARVDATGAAFREAVVAARGDVPEDAMRGQWFRGSQAGAMNLIDAVGEIDRAVVELRGLMGGE